MNKAYIIYIIQGASLHWNYHKLYNTAILECKIQDCYVHKSRLSMIIFSIMNTEYLYLNMKLCYVHRAKRYDIKIILSFQVLILRKRDQQRSTVEIKQS